MSRTYNVFHLYIPPEEDSEWDQLKEKFQKGKLSEFVRKAVMDRAYAENILLRETDVAEKHIEMVIDGEKYAGTLTKI